MWLVFFFQTFVPLLLLLTIALMRHPSGLRWAINTIAFGSVLCFMWASSRWDFISMYVRTALPIAFMIAAAIGYLRIQKPEQPVSRLQAVVAVAINVLLIGTMGILNWLTFSGYPKPEGTIALTSPLRDGRYVVIHGGSSAFINAHAKIRPQNHALDIVGLNEFGRRFDFTASRSDLDSYVIYGAPLYSPCNGIVVAAVDQYDDLIPPARDSKNLAGNHVLIKYGEIEVLLAHLKKGSIRVRIGDFVTSDTIIGRVGNSGNTSEPHLHLHAEYGGKPGTILDGKAVPITIDGRFLRRGDILTDAGIN